MFERPSQSEQTDPLVKRARREAARSSPYFSEELHGKIMRAVKTADVADAPSDRLVPRPSRISASSVVTALVAVAVGTATVGVLQYHQTPNAPVVASVQPGESAVAAAPAALPDVHKVEAVPRQVTMVVETAMAQQQWAGLDHDARAVARYLADQVPFRDTWKNP